MQVTLTLQTTGNQKTLIYYKGEQRPEERDYFDNLVAQAVASTLCNYAADAAQLIPAAEAPTRK